MRTTAAGTLAAPTEHAPTGQRTLDPGWRLGHGSLLAGALCLAGIAAVTAVARTTGPTGTPILPAGDWRPTLWVGLIAAFAAYLLGIAVVPRSGGERGVLALAVGIQVVPLAGPLFASTDVNSYVQYGRANPYGDWHTASVYGPLWSALSEGFDRVGDAATLFRLLATGSVLVLLFLTYRLASRKALAVAFLGWNPIVALHFGGGGHNDSFMMALAVAGIALAAASRPQLAGAVWVASSFVKWVTAPLYLLWAIEQRRRGRAIGLWGGIVAAVAIVALAYPLYQWTWLDAFNAYSGVDRMPAAFGMRGWLTDLGLSTSHALATSKLLELAALSFFALQAWRSRLRLGLAAGVLTVLAPHIQAWYLLWGIVLSALDDRDRAGKVLAVALSALLLSDILSPLLNA